MSRDSASANRVAEEVYPIPWCWISFLLINHLPTITRTAFHDIYMTVLCVLGGPTVIFNYRNIKEDILSYFITLLFKVYNYLLNPLLVLLLMQY
jgi:hypothetical protein